MGIFSMCCVEMGILVLYNHNLDNQWCDLVLCGYFDLIDCVSKDGLSLLLCMSSFTTKE